MFANSNFKLDVANHHHHHQQTSEASSSKEDQPFSIRKMSELSLATMTTECSTSSDDNSCSHLTPIEDDYVDDDSFHALASLEDDPFYFIAPITKSVGFGDVTVREFSQTLGDNPCVTEGPPLTLSWDCVRSTTKSLDEYESKRVLRRRSVEELLLSEEERTRILACTGVDHKDMLWTESKMQKIRKQRMATVKALKKEEEVEYKKRKGGLAYFGFNRTKSSEHAVVMDENEQKQKRNMLQKKAAKWKRSVALFTMSSTKQ